MVDTLFISVQIYQMSNYMVIINYELHYSHGDMVS